MGEKKSLQKQARVYLNSTGYKGTDMAIQSWVWFLRKCLYDPVWMVHSLNGGTKQTELSEVLLWHEPALSYTSYQMEQHSASRAQCVMSALGVF